MVAEENLVYGLRLSSVGPSNVTGQDVVHHPSNMDLAMKLHYIKCVYIYNSEANSKNVSIVRMKEAMFRWLNHHYVMCGRFRRSEEAGGRPYVKCNDCGIRFVEAKCDKSVEEWLELGSSHDDLLVYYAPLGPELPFSPLVYFQVTYFKCGGLAFGLNWAHVLGDAFTVSDWTNSMSPWMTGSKLNAEPKLTKFEKPKGPNTISKGPFAVKLVDPVGDNWITPSDCKMKTFSFHMTSTQLSHIQSKISLAKNKAPKFESICAIIWKCVAIARDTGSDPKVVTTMKNDPTREKGQMGNHQVICSVQANFSIFDANLDDLAKLLVDEGVDEGRKIEAAMEKEGGLADYIVYGANLTFLNCERTDLYNFEMDGHKPDLVHYSIQNVGEGGVVMVLPGKRNSDDGVDDVGRFVTVTLPEKEVMKVKNELRKNGVLVENNFK
ncbi:hypothetical protein ACFE04_015430 [Oxalis oulophora]